MQKVVEMVGPTRSAKTPLVQGLKAPVSASAARASLGIGLDWEILTCQATLT